MEKPFAKAEGFEWRLTSSEGLFELEIGRRQLLKKPKLICSINDECRRHSDALIQSDARFRKCSQPSYCDRAAKIFLYLGLAVSGATNPVSPDW